MNVNNSNHKIELGKGIIVNEGNDLTIVAHGKMVLVAVKVRELLLEKGIEAEIINLRFLKPLDTELINKSINKTNKLVILDETSEDSSVSMKIVSSITNKNIKTRIKTFPDIFIKHGNVNDIFEKYKIDADNIASDMINKFK